MKKLALLALICLGCGSSKRSVIVVSLSYDTTVRDPEAIKNLQVTVEGVLKNYPVPASAPFQKCTAAAPCTLEIDTANPGRLDIAVAGTGAISVAGYLVLGTGSGSAIADPSKVQSVPIELSCASGGCGMVGGPDGGAGAGGLGGSISGRGGTSGGAGETLGAGGSVAGAGGRGGASGGGGMAGAAGAVGTAGIAGTIGAAGSAGMTGAAGTSGVAGATGAGGTIGAAGRGGTTGSAGMTGAAGRGGTTGSAGATGAGGGGNTGPAGTAGTAGGGGAPGTGGVVGANCVDYIKLNGYSYAPAMPCSACVDNQVSQATKCQSIIDCLDAHYPCTGNCEINCENIAGATNVVFGCASALVNAACN